MEVEEPPFINASMHPGVDRIPMLYTCLARETQKRMLNSRYRDFLGVKMCLYFQELRGSFFYIRGWLRSFFSFLYSTQTNSSKTCLGLRVQNSQFCLDKANLDDCMFLWKLVMHVYNTSIPASAPPHPGNAPIGLLSQWQWVSCVRMYFLMIKENT